jgi:hypothetical protein
MAKLGRNDPCPCGSAKKYKQCCLGAAKPPTLLHRLPEVIQEERLKAEQIARRWLGEEDPEPGQAYPMRDAKGRKLILVLDRFSVLDAEAVRQVRALGRSDQERVLFFDGSQWIGEADFSVAGEMLLVTPRKELSDRLLALLRPIAGLLHKERQIDELAALDHAPTGGGGLLDFKKTFFAAWLDEPNEKLDGVTPREAAVSPGLRPRLIQLLADLESKESKLPKSERFSFAPLRATLGV